MRQRLVVSDLDANLAGISLHGGPETGFERRVAAAEQHETGACFDQTRQYGEQQVQALLRGQPGYGAEQRPTVFGAAIFCRIEAETPRERLLRVPLVGNVIILRRIGGRY